jgi:hypothetical protein
MDFKNLTLEELVDHLIRNNGQCGTECPHTICHATLCPLKGLQKNYSDVIEDLLETTKRVDRLDSDLDEYANEIYTLKGELEIMMTKFKLKEDE